MQVNGACSCRKVTICSGMLITFTGKSRGGYLKAFKTVCQT